MARGNIEATTAEGIWDELDRRHQAISRRAYDLFENHGLLWGNALEHWLTAEQELIWKPAVELREEEGQFEVLAALPGIEAKNLDIQITPDDVLIKADTAHDHTAHAGTVHICEFTGRKIFRLVHFPEQIDPNSAKAEYQNGILHLTVAIARAATAQKVEVDAA